MRRVVALITAAALGLPGSAACAAAPESALAGLGVSPGHSLLWTDDAALEADMAAVARSGARWVRLDIDWSVVEPVRGAREWGALDRAVDAARRHDLRVLGLLAYTPAWARPPGTTTHAPPTDATAFAAFAGAAAQRYRTEVDAWEVWNEPNIPDFWTPHPDPAAYAALLVGTAAAVRAEDPEATLLAGGLAPAVNDGRALAPADFLEAVYAAGGGPAFDAVGVHPYSYPALPDDPVTGGWNTFVRLPQLHAVMTRHGDAAKTVWLTEFGAPTGTGDGAVSPERQARILDSGFTEARRLPFVGPVFVYALRDSGTDPADREQNFGLLRADGTPKPAWDVLRAEAARPEDPSARPQEVQP